MRLPRFCTALLLLLGGLAPLHAAQRVEGYGPWRSALSKVYRRSPKAIGVSPKSIGVSSKPLGASTYPIAGFPQPIGGFPKPIAVFHNLSVTPR